MAPDPARVEQVGKVPVIHGINPWFWAALCFLVAFAIWSSFLVKNVTFERAQVEARVAWMVEAQALQDDIARGDVASAQARATSLLADIRGRAPALGEVAAALPASAERGDPGPASDLVRAIRAETGELSGRLGRRWSVLTVLVGIGLLLGSAVLVLLVVVDHRRRVAEAYRQALLTLLEERTNPPRG